MTFQKRAAAEQLLKDITEELRVIEAAGGEGQEEKQSQLVRRAVNLRRLLSGDGGGPAVLSRPR